MNTNPLAKRILCFGDSYTFGTNPETNKRFPVNIRWTGVLQNLLGSAYEIIEEGIGGRTTNLDDDRPGRNGLSAFYSIAMSHMPLDLIILFIETNDLKSRFERTPSDISNVFREYKNAIDIASKNKEDPFPKVLLISPPIAKDQFIPKDWDFFDATNRSKELEAEYEKIAKELNFEFLSSKNVEVSNLDGLHLDETNNKLLAESISQKIVSLF